MTIPQKRTALLAILTALLGAVTMPFLRAAWESKVSTSSFDLYAQTIDTRLQRLAAQDSVQREMTLDILCAVTRQQDRRCK